MTRQRLRLDPDVHRRRAWRVHDLAAGFDLLDVWRIPVRAGAADPGAFGRFLALFVENGIETDGRVANALFAARFAIGRALRWDAPDPERRIPERAERSVRDRLPERERAELGSMIGPEGSALVYGKAEEALFEVANATVHALIHLGWVDDGAGGRTAELAVYVAPRGGFGRAYMKAIGPFRHALVYPAWIGRLVRIFAAREEARGGRQRARTSTAAIS